MLTIGVSQEEEESDLSEGVALSREHKKSPIRLSRNVIVQQRLAASNKGNFGMVSGSEESFNNCRVAKSWPAQLEKSMQHESPRFSQLFSHTATTCFLHVRSRQRLPVSTVM